MRSALVQAADVRRANAQHMRQLRAKRRAAGLCVECGRVPSRRERTTCAACGKRCSWRTMESRARRRAA